MNDNIEFLRNLAIRRGFSEPPVQPRVPWYRDPAKIDPLIAGDTSEFKLGLDHLTWMAATAAELREDGAIPGIPALTKCQLCPLEDICPAKKPWKACGRSCGVSLTWKPRKAMKRNHCSIVKAMEKAAKRGEDIHGWSCLLTGCERCGAWRPTFYGNLRAIKLRKWPGIIDRNFTKNWRYNWFVFGAYIVGSLVVIFLSHNVAGVIIGWSPWCLIWGIFSVRGTLRHRREKVTRVMNRMTGKESDGN